MTEEVICLRLKRVGSDSEDGVREFGVLVAVVEFADPHVARRMNLRIVGGPVVNPDVLDLHALEVELARGPGILVTAARAAMVIGGDDDTILTLFLDDSARDLGDKPEGVVPRRRVEPAIAPHHRLSKALRLGPRGRGEGHLGDPRTTDRPKAGIHDAVRIRLDYEMHVPAVLLDDVIHRRREPIRGHCALLLGKSGIERVAPGSGTALVIDVPAINFVAATDDAVMANRVVDRCVLWRNRKPVDMALVGHRFLPTP